MKHFLPILALLLAGAGTTTLFGCASPLKDSGAQPGATGTSTQVLTLVGDEGEASGVPDSGKERWSQKLLRDPSAKLVNFTPMPTTVEKLSALTPPFTKPPKTGDQTRYPAEMQTYSVTGQVVGLKLEADKDVHFVIRGDSGATMIIEFPDPAQSAKGIKGPEAAKARADCVSLFGKPGKWRLITGRKVTVTGPLFFDVKHATPQTGVAVNGAEIHEVLSIVEVKP